MNIFQTSGWSLKKLRIGLRNNLINNSKSSLYCVSVIIKCRINSLYDIVDIDVSIL